MPELPTRLSADGVVPSRGTFDGYARFRSDGRRVLDLAMGIELYKDRDLAVRELYQNALDACRYRRARQEYLDRTTGSPGEPYTGSISFVQGLDDDGRAYLDCVDDGIGMGEAELRGVFSHAGARFAEQLEFKLERARWESLDPPVKLYPNSRFGIGVLSYFMLAEEIRVTTCRMDTDGVPGTEYEVSICGPGHLFRINQKAARGRVPGTRVRLYLRNDIEPENWSVIDVLRQVLGIAEFATTARKGGLTAVWEPGQLRGRRMPPNTGAGLNAHGVKSHWSAHDGGGQVVWCEHGGALLVDGLIVEPTLRKGVFSATGPGLTGAVVNLCGPSSVARLSVDRRHVLDDVSLMVRKMLEQATDALTEVDGDLPGFRWLCRVAEASATLADIAACAIASHGLELTYSGMAFGGRLDGCFPADLDLVPKDPHQEPRYGVGPWGNVHDDAPDHIYLWRILDRRPERALRTLAEVCPEIDAPRPVRRPRPSDQWLLMSNRPGSHSLKWHRQPFDLQDIAQAADNLQCTSLEVAARLAGLGFPDTDPRHWEPGALLTTANSTVFKTTRVDALTRGKPLTSADLMRAAQRANDTVAPTSALLRRFGFHVPAKVENLCRSAEKDELLWLNPQRPSDGCLDPDTPVSLGHIAQASIRLEIPVPEVCRRLMAHGLHASPGRLPNRPTPESMLLLSMDLDYEPPWVDQRQPLSPGHVLFVANELGMEPTDVLAEFTALGFSLPEVFPADADANDLSALHDEFDGQYLIPPGPISYGHIFHNVRDLNGLRHRIHRLRAYGFDITVAVPRRPTSLDREILSASGPLNWWLVNTDEALPFAHVLLAARSLGASPGAIAKRLHVGNIPTSHDNLPKGLSFREALRLIRADEVEEGEVPTVAKFPLEYLHKTALRKRTSIRHIVSLLNDLGIPVPDPADTIRAALARVPRPRPTTPDRESRPNR
ncbi:ATP-binding protein [Streptomyces sp. NPDC048179]|uniref:wHTH domain-containing protein n=1 Tax=Streptomyces sp. NPDC048179 TaxID=3365506 RepID=UPI00371D4CAB